MSNLPTFFFSHARSDGELPGSFLTKFFRDLEGRLKAAGEQGNKLGVIDKRIKHGNDWDTDLSDGLTKSRAFIAIFSPLYFTRENCGKELGEFLLRNPAMKIDTAGSLADVKNVLPIRWYPESFYTRNAGKDSIIPPLLSRIEDVPAEDLDDAERDAAIKRYRKKGMEACVDNQPSYRELLTMLVERIKDMQELPAPNPPVSFATARNAFLMDWAAYLGGKGAQTNVAAVAAAASQAPPAPPRGLAYVGAFFLTNRPHTRSAEKVPFADALLAEPMPGELGGTDADLAKLFSDLRRAGTDENLLIYNSASAQPVLQAHLRNLSASCVPLLLVVDADLWPNADATRDTVLDAIIRSSDWAGLVLVANFSSRVLNLDAVAKERGLPSRIFEIPSDPLQRIPELRRALVEARGRAMRASTEHAPGAEAVPYVAGNK
jgi:hypothetical protein